MMERQRRIYIRQYNAAEYRFYFVFYYNLPVRFERIQIKILNRKVLKKANKFNWMYSLFVFSLGIIINLGIKFKNGTFRL